jgi:hemerythrin-like domain-containing protein
MSTPLSMNKIIHGAVRRDLDRFLDALAAFPDGNQQRATQLGVAWDYFFSELDYHHHGEHEIAWPALASVGVSEQLLAEMDAEHERMAEVLHAAGAAMARLRSAPTAANAQAAHQAVVALRDVTEDHLRHEESELEPVYWDKHDTAEIKAMGRKFSRRNPKAAGDFFAWIENGASAEEHASLRQSVPAPVIAIFGKVLGRNYRRTVAPVWSG